jgi:hypothetical protein
MNPKEVKKTKWKTNPRMSTITLNVNGLSIPIKRQRY